MAIIRIEKPDVFIGMDEVRARQEIIDHGYECKIVHRDGRTLDHRLKPDYDPLRVNLTIMAGKVTKADIG